MFYIEYYDNEASYLAGNTRIIKDLKTLKGVLSRLKTMGIPHKAKTLKIFKCNEQEFYKEYKHKCVYSQTI